MSQSQIDAFLQAASSDPTLQDKLKIAKNPESVVEIAQQAGFTLSVDDIKNGQSALSEEELQGLSGGLSYKQSFCGDCEGQ